MPRIDLLVVDLTELEHLSRESTAYSSAVRCRALSQRNWWTSLVPSKRPKPMLVLPTSMVSSMATMCHSKICRLRLGRLGSAVRAKS